MVTYYNGPGALDQNFRVNSGTAVGPINFDGGSLLNGRTYAVNFKTDASECIIRLQYSPFRKHISGSPWFLLKFLFTILIPSFREV